MFRRKEIRLGHALDTSGAMVCARKARREETYRCPECGGGVILRQGPVMAAHFSHGPGAECGEGLVHRAAKLALVGVIDAAGSGACLTVLRPCDACGARTRGPLCIDVDGAVAEMRVAGGRVVDVGLTMSGRCVGAIEIRHSHGVSSQKAWDLGVPWMEVEARAIVDSPTVLMPTRMKWSGTCVCGACNDLLARFISLRERIGVLRGQPVLSGEHRTAPYRCWKCRKGVLVYTKASANEGSHEIANACAVCLAPISRRQLIEETDGPFTPAFTEDERLDLARVARRMVNVGGCEF